jgi:sec-independent protein translocase protein TatA
MTASFAYIFGLGPTELIIVLVIGILLFGRKLPEMGKYLGKSIIEFKKGMRGLEDNIDEHSPTAATTSAGAPMDAIRPPQKVTATAPKFEDSPVNTGNPPQV